MCQIHLFTPANNKICSNHQTLNTCSFIIKTCFIDPEIFLYFFCLICITKCDNLWVFFFYQTDWKHGYSQHPHHCTLHKTPKFPYSFLFRKAPTILINNNMYSEKNSILIYFCPHCKWTNSNFQTFKIILLLTKLWNSEHGSIRSNQTSTGIPALAVNKLHFYFIYWFISNIQTIDLVGILIFMFCTINVSFLKKYWPGVEIFKIILFEQQESIA